MTYSLQSKKVLIVSRRLIRKNKPINWVSEIYLELLAELGIVPIIVPIVETTRRILPDYLADYDGLLMMEGGDISPDFYGENYDTKTLNEHDALKDEIEISCLKHALDSNKAVLGFCRGMQLINIVRGGTLFRDVYEWNNYNIKHIDYDNYDTYRHRIRLIEGTPLHKWYDRASELSVNSYHHQGIKTLGKNLQPMAFSDDGLTEAVYDPSRRFVVGIQFHPERMLDEYAGNRRIFEAFAENV